jgi:gamma-glutamyl-gamma-aminobutyrate hydrolase PuuD
MRNVEHPLIAVNGCLEPGDDPRATLRTRYADAVLRAGGVPVGVPSVGGPRDLARLLEHVDGLVLGGGDDFDTARLGLGPTHPAAVVTPPTKQDHDLELARLALELGVPVLGICYGMQALVLAEGGTILQHLPEDRPGCRDHTGRGTHAVTVTPGSKLAELLGVEDLAVVSQHHQAVDDPGPRFRACATDDEGLIEAVELAGEAEHPFAVGVQWHPELSPEGTENDRLFRGLVGAAGTRAARSAFQTSPAR